MTDLRLSIGKETSSSEENELLDSFRGVNVEISKSIIRLNELEIPMIVEFSINAVFGGILWDAIKISIQRLRKKESLEIKRKIIQKVVYKNETIFITKDSIQIKSQEKIKITTIEEAIDSIDKNT